jgi:hypothetical protein
MKKKSINSFFFHCDIPVWESQLIVVVGSNWKHTKKCWEKVYSDRCDIDFQKWFGDFEKMQAGMCYFDDLRLAALHLSNPDNHGILAHECIHLAWKILEWKGVQLTESNHEALAYLVDWIMNRIIKEWELAKKRIS